MTDNRLDFAALSDLAGRRPGIYDESCPLCGPSRHSPANRKRRVLRVWMESDFASFHCARCGEHGWARDDGAAAIEPARLERLHREAANRDRIHAAKQLDKARWLLRRRKPWRGSPVEIYLREARGITGPVPALLGYLPPGRPGHHPAMIATFGLADEPEPGQLAIGDGAVQGVHLTLLRPDGSGKAEVERQKLMVGPSAGWPIILAPSGDGLALAICEGIEDALTCHAATGLGAWAAGAAGRMPGLADKIPDHIECVTIFADDDEAGQRGAHGLAEALAARGIEVLIEGAAWRPT